MSKAQEELDKHPTATVAYVNAEGEWHFSTPPTDFVVVETLVKGAEKQTKEVIEEKEVSKKGKK